MKDDPWIWNFPMLGWHTPSTSLVLFLEPMIGYAYVNRGPVRSIIGELGHGYCMDDFKPYHVSPTKLTQIILETVK